MKRAALRALEGSPGTVDDVLDEMRSGYLLSHEDHDRIFALVTADPAGDSFVDRLARIEPAHPDARLPLPGHPGATVTWHDLPPGGRSGDALFDAVRAADLDPGARVWVAGEAAAVQRIRKHLFDDRSFPRAQTAVR